MRNNYGLNNAIIAKFMGGFKFHPEEIEVGASEYCDNVWHVSNKKYEKGYYTSLSFHSSWDWLMPVVEKINKLLYPDEDDGYADQLIEGGNELIFDFERSCYFGYDNETIKTIYKKCVDFIKWYNKNK
jgi:hypothetical protein